MHGQGGGEQEDRYPGQQNPLGGAIHGSISGALSARPQQPPCGEGETEHEQRPQQRPEQRFAWDVEAMVWLSGKEKHAQRASHAAPEQRRF